MVSLGRSKAISAVVLGGLLFGYVLVEFGVKKQQVIHLQATAPHQLNIQSPQRGLKAVGGGGGNSNNNVSQLLLHGGDDEAVIHVSADNIMVSNVFGDAVTVESIASTARSSATKHEKHVSYYTVDMYTYTYI